MFGLFGTRMIGEVHRVDETFVATRFFHVNFLPIAPTSSFIVLPTGEHIDVGLRASSVLAGFARSYAIAIALVGVGFIVLGDGTTKLVGVCLTVGAIVAAGLAFTVIGRLPPRGRAARLAYALHAEYPLNYPFDVALLSRKHRERLRDAIVLSVNEWASSLTSRQGYRDDPQASTQWLDVALDANVDDVHFLADALLLARLESSLATRAARVKFRRVHEATLDRLVSSMPTLVAEARKASVDS